MTIGNSALINQYSPASFNFLQSVVRLIPNSLADLLLLKWASSKAFRMMLKSFSFLFRWNCSFTEVVVPFRSGFLIFGEYAVSSRYISLKTFGLKHEPERSTSRSIKFLS